MLETTEDVSVYSTGQIMETYAEDDNSTSRKTLNMLITPQERYWILLTPFITPPEGC